MEKRNQNLGRTNKENSIDGKDSKGQEYYSNRHNDNGNKAEYGDNYSNHSSNNKESNQKENMNESNAIEENNKEPKHETIESNLKSTSRKLQGCKNSSKSSNMYQTNKSTKFKTSRDFNKKNPASVYIKELKRCAELNKKRNQTAKLPLHKLKIVDAFSLYLTRGKITMPVQKSSKILLEETHQKSINEMNNPKNLYSAYWSNKILEKRYKMEFGVNGFINGVPIVTIQKIKAPLKKLLEEKEEDPDEAQEPQEADEINDNDNVNPQFNTNQKNFFKARKDIAEEAGENEEDKDHLPQSEIEFGVIYKYFDTQSALKENNNK